MLSTYLKVGKHLIYLKVNWVLFFYSDYYITNVKSKAISKKIIRINEKIKKTFLDILSAFQPPSQSEVGKHSTVKIFPSSL